MDTLGNAILGLMFLLLGATGTFLMYRLWGYPFDHEKLRSSAPPHLLMVHRIIGYAYGAIYIYLMVQMVPRLWTYQVEFPARTVAHLMLGMSIGIIIVIKVVIVRFFKHLESELVPLLGTGLLICTFLLVGLSVPFALKEVYLHQRTVGGNAFSGENIERVKVLLPRAGFSADADLAELASVQALKGGRSVLLTKCVQCHDLRTVLVKPRTPENWVQTVERMADRAVFDPISEREQWYVATYLIAITPELQMGFRERRKQELEARKSQEVVRATMLPGSGSAAFSLADARNVFEESCTQCHGLKNIEKSPPTTEGEVSDLVERMVENGLEASEGDLQKVMYYLTNTYVKQH